MCSRTSLPVPRPQGRLAAASTAPPTPTPPRLWPSLRALDRAEREERQRRAEAKRKAEEAARRAALEGRARAKEARPVKKPVPGPVAGAAAAAPAGGRGAAGGPGLGVKPGLVHKVSVRAGRASSVICCFFLPLRYAYASVWLELSCSCWVWSLCCFGSMFP